MCRSLSPDDIVINGSSNLASPVSVCVSVSVSVSVMETGMETDAGVKTVDGIVDIRLSCINSGARMVG